MVPVEIKVHTVQSVGDFLFCNLKVKLVSKALFVKKSCSEVSGGVSRCVKHRLLCVSVCW